MSITKAIKVNKEKEGSLKAKFGEQFHYSQHFEHIAQGTLMATLPMKLEAVEEDKIIATMLVDERSCQTMGCLHGGASMAFAETIGGYGSYLLIPPHQAAVGLHIAGNHLSMAKKGETIRAIATLIHQGRTTHLWQIDLFSQETERLVSSIRLTNSIITPR